MFESLTFEIFPFTLPGWGFSLAIVYLIWMFVVVALILPCRWFRLQAAPVSDPWPVTVSSRFASRKY